MKTLEHTPDGSIEDIQHSYGVNFRDPIESGMPAQQQEQRLARNKWLGRLLMAVSARNPVRTEQHMRENIEAARQAAQPWAESRRPHFEAAQPQATVEQLPDSAHQQPDQQPIPGAPAEAANHYAPRHAAEK
jgi:hypothetical protein